MDTIKKIDELRGKLTTPEQKKLLTEIRKSVKKSENFKGRLYDYYVDTIDGVSCEFAAKDNKLM